jgi:integrase
MDEIRQLLRSCQDRSKGRNRLIIALALNAGLRQSEILGLLWGNVDFKAKTITVDGQLERARTEDGNWLPAIRVKYAKTDAGNRSVGLIPTDLFKVLAEFKIASAHTAGDDLVFGTGDGKRLVDHRNVAKRFDAAKSRAKIGKAGKPSLRFHDLRHTYASANIAAGVDVVYLSRQLGHANPSITMDVYADLFEAREKADTSRNALEKSGYAGLV